MNLFNKIIKIYLLPAALTLPMLSSCIADDIAAETERVPENPSVGIYHKPNSFAAFRIGIADTPKSRAGQNPVFDSDDVGNLALNFNKGQAFERAIYIPAAAEEIEEELLNLGSEGEEIEEYDQEGEGGDPVPGDPNEGDDDLEDLLESNVYHFAILVNDDETVVPQLYPLYPKPERKEDNTEYTMYMAYYSAEEDTEEAGNPYLDFQGKTVYVVLNASHALVEKMKETLENDNLQLFHLQQFTIGGGLVRVEGKENNEAFPYNDDFLYLKDEEGNFILDENNNPYLTMSSSMIINDKNKVVPAVDGDFIPKSSLQEAKDNSTKIYIERLTAKYTVLFQGGTHTLVGTDGKMEVHQSGYKLFLTEGNINTTSEGIVPTNRIIIKPREDRAQEIKYVASYTRGNYAIGDREPVEVHKTKNWKVNIIGWGINALQPQEYLFKNLNPNHSYTSEDWFKSANNYRNFWAVDPNYNDKRYPDQYREARYMPATNSAGERNNQYEVKDDITYIEIANESIEGGKNRDGYMPNPAFKYFSFKELSQRNLRQYTPEHTFPVTGLKDQTSYDDRSHLRIGTHLIIAAQLLIGGEEGYPFELDNVYETQYFNSDGTVVNSINRARSKYLMNNIFWEEKAYITYVTEYLGYWMHAEENKDIFGANDGIFYVNTEGAVAEAGDFIIEQAHIEGGDGMVWVKPAPGVDLYSFNPDAEDDPETEEDDRYSPIHPDDYRALAYQHQNYMAQCFNEGRMYYSTGSLHANPSNINPQTPATGDYGTVRNNWYYFTIDAINKIGSPVSVIDQPIVPNNEPGETGLGVSLQILDWHLQTEDVNVGSQKRPNDAD